MSFEELERSFAPTWSDFSFFVHFHFIFTVFHAAKILIHSPIVSSFKLSNNLTQISEIFTVINFFSQLFSESFFHSEKFWRMKILLRLPQLRYELILFRKLRKMKRKFGYCSAPMLVFSSVQSPFASFSWSPPIFTKESGKLRMVLCWIVKFSESFSFFLPREKHTRRLWLRLKIIFLLTIRDLRAWNSFSRESLEFEKCSRKRIYVTNICFLSKNTFIYHQFLFKIPSTITNWIFLLMHWDISFYRFYTNFSWFLVSRLSQVWCTQIEEVRGCTMSSCI